MGKHSLTQLLDEARACTLCEPELPLGARPIIRASTSARLLIIGQAPGTKVHESGVPWDDPSGERLRAWLGLDKEAFYDETRVALLPMGFCYPGRQDKGGDNPPRPECAPRWHSPLLAAMPRVELTLLVGAYAQAHYLGKRRARTMTETVARWRDYGPTYLPTPHPSWRAGIWLKKNAFFERDVVPELQRRTRRLVGA